jgi:hypothetical protein
MITGVLVLAEIQSVKMVRSLGGAVGFAIFVALVVLVVVCIYRAAEYFGSAKKEQKLLRIEMGKIAEEVHQLRQELTEIKGEDSPSRSE